MNTYESYEKLAVAYLELIIQDYKNGGYIDRAKGKNGFWHTFTKSDLADMIFGDHLTVAILDHYGIDKEAAYDSIVNIYSKGVNKK